MMKKKTKKNKKETEGKINNGETYRMNVRVKLNSKCLPRLSLRGKKENYS
jgi:hypothetical protein